MQHNDSASADSLGPASADDLHARFDPAFPIFVLIDPMLGEPLPAVRIVEDALGAQRAREAGWERDITPIVLSPRVTLSPHLHPYLVALTGADDPLLPITLSFAHAERAQSQAEGLDGEGGAAHRVGGWLHTSMHAEALAQQIARMCDARAAGATSATYLRLVDRRTIGLLSQVVGAERLTGQFGRLRSWTYLDPRGQLATLHSRGEQEINLRLSGEEWRILERGETVHRALAKWLGEMMRLERAPELAVADLYARFVSAEKHAHTAAKAWPHRFPGMHDYTTWTALSVLVSNLAANNAVRGFMQNRGTAEQPAELMRYLHGPLCALASNSATTTA